MKQAATKHATGPFPTANGVLTFPSQGARTAFRSFTIYGGPYAAFAPAQPGEIKRFGICLREEVPRGSVADVHLPIDDFSVPRDPVLVADTIVKAYRAGLGGKDVFAGCMGGMGRTGLFLAILAKAMGEKDPVPFVRKNYYSRAVETQEQAQYVKDFDVTDLRKKLVVEAWLSRAPRSAAKYLQHRPQILAYLAKSA